MEEKIMQAPGEFNKVIDFVTREALTTDGEGLSPIHQSS